MEIFINGVKTEIEKKNGNLINLLNNIEKKLIGDGEIIVDLKLDGERVDGARIPLLKKNVKIIELTTRTHREIIIESLYLLEKFYEKFCFTYETLENEEIELSKITEIIGFIEWVLGIVLSLKDATAMTYIYTDYEEFANDFKKYCEQLFKAFKQEDYYEVFEIIDMVLFDMLAMFVENSKQHLKEVIEEEKRGKLYN